MVANTATYPSQTLELVDSFYRSGSLVFGGGHVVLPLLQAEVVPGGWVSNDAFLAGYGAAQAVPGPLFTFAAFLGTVMTDEPNGIVGAMICLFAVFATNPRTAWLQLPVKTRTRILQIDRSSRQRFRLARRSLPFPRRPRM